MSVNDVSVVMTTIDIGRVTVKVILSIFFFMSLLNRKLFYINATTQLYCGVPLQINYRHSPLILKTMPDKADCNAFWGKIEPVERNFSFKLNQNINNIL